MKARRKYERRAIASGSALLTNALPAKQHKVPGLQTSYLRICCLDVLLMEVELGEMDENVAG
jgi:hypothetical protein